MRSESGANTEHLLGPLLCSPLPHPPSMCWASEHSPFYSLWQPKANLRGKALLTALSKKKTQKPDSALTALHPGLWWVQHHHDTLKSPALYSSLWKWWPSKALTAQPEQDKQDSTRTFITSYNQTAYCTKINSATQEGLHRCLERDT